MVNNLARRNRPLVLVIDDEPLVLNSLKITLEAQGFNVATALGGKSGLEIFRERRPAIVLTDILMPRGGGFETIAALRREQADVKIVAMSGGGRVGKTEFVAVAATLGAHATIKKPFRASDLAAIMHDLLEPGSGQRVRAQRAAVTLSLPPRGRVGAPPASASESPPVVRELPCHMS